MLILSYLVSWPALENGFSSYNLVFYEAKSLMLTSLNLSMVCVDLCNKLAPHVSRLHLKMVYSFLLSDRNRFFEHRYACGICHKRMRLWTSKCKCKEIGRGFTSCKTWSEMPRSKQQTFSKSCVHRRISSLDGKAPYFLPGKGSIDMIAQSTEKPFGVFQYLSQYIDEMLRRMWPGIYHTFESITGPCDLPLHQMNAAFDGTPTPFAMRRYFRVGSRGPRFPVRVQAWFASFAMFDYANVEIPAYYNDELQHAFPAIPSCAYVYQVRSQFLPSSYTKAKAYIRSLFKGQALGAQWNLNLVDSDSDSESTQSDDVSLEYFANFPREIHFNSFKAAVASRPNIDCANLIKAYIPLCCDSFMTMSFNGEKYPCWSYGILLSWCHREAWCGGTSARSGEIACLDAFSKHINLAIKFIRTYPNLFHDFPGALYLQLSRVWRRILISNYSICVPQSAIELIFQMLGYGLVGKVQPPQVVDYDRMLNDANLICLI